MDGIKRKRYTAAFKAKVGLEAIRGVKTVSSAWVIGASQVIDRPCDAVPGPPKEAPIIGRPLVASRAKNHATRRAACGLLHFQRLMGVDEGGASCPAEIADLIGVPLNRPCMFPH